MMRRQIFVRLNPARTLKEDAKMSEIQFFRKHHNEKAISQLGLRGTRAAHCSEPMEKRHETATLQN
jgi:hypothetical protein